MTVRELIKTLNAFNPEREVAVEVLLHGAPIRSIIAVVQRVDPGLLIDKITVRAVEE